VVDLRCGGPYSLAETILGTGERGQGAEDCRQSGLQMVRDWGMWNRYDKSVRWAWCDVWHG